MDQHEHTEGRRSLLKKAAVAAGAAWVAPVILSQPAMAQGSNFFSVTLSADTTDLPLTPCATLLTTVGVDNGDGTVTGTATLSNSGARFLNITSLGANVISQVPSAGTALPGETLVVIFDGFPSSVEIFWECVT